MKIAVIGSEGYVGNAFCEMVKKHYDVVRYDLKLEDKNSTVKEVNSADLAVIALPTPMSRTEFIEVDGLKVYKCDTSILEDAIKWIETPVILIKSTIPVGTVDRLKKETGKRIVFSPEYVGETKYRVNPELNFHTDMGATPFFILGGDEEDCNYILDMLVPVLGPQKKYYKVSAKTAEFIKYKENDYFAHKVIWANEARQQAEALGVDWYEAWQGWALDPRVDPMHTGVFKGDEGFAGSCFPKDTNALCYSLMEKGFKSDFQIAMLKKNLKLKKCKDYQELSGRKKNHN
ncbi:hypothetical protein JW887_00185 [Candidatus Dojkabacteria bacterium]|nr:hypothetical protein [Candidatus Dojkabacteria bacterium]